MSPLWRQFWSNFEIADMRFFRSKLYSDYFEYLDKTGGFYYERWGDAPVHSIAAAFFLPRSQIHFFSDIGYRHSPYIRCPQDEESHLSGRCSCERANNFGTCIFIIMSNCRLWGIFLHETVGSNIQDAQKDNRDQPSRRNTQQRHITKSKQVTIQIGKEH